MKVSSKQTWFEKFIGKTPMTKRQRILNLFTKNIGRNFYSSNLHSTFGSSFRSRVSEINRDPYSTITIFNRTTFTNDSKYWSELRLVGNDAGSY